VGRKQPPQCGPEEFRAFLEWLNPDARKAAEDYNRLMRRLHLFFEGWHDAAADSADLADVSIDRAIQKLKEEPDLISRNAASYVLTVARYILLEFRKRVRPGPLEVDPPDLRPAPETTGTQQLECLERCLSELPAEDYELLKKYHLYDEGDRARARRVVAEGLGQSAGAIRVRVFRICRSLEECIEDCMKERGL
jgi:DNA-directed RNA polymerase specialized sigma24 family protein